MNETTDRAIVAKLNRGTLYVRSEFLGNYVAIEAKDIEVAFRPYAQYASAIEVRFTPKGARKPRGFIQDYSPSLVVLDGWGHFSPASAYDGTSTSRHLCHSEGWSKDFAGELAAYLERSGAKIAADFRGHNPHSKYAA